MKALPKRLRVGDGSNPNLTRSQRRARRPPTFEALEPRLLLAAPVVKDDLVQTRAGTAAIINPLANDSDPDGNVLTVIGYDSVTNGLVTQNGNPLTFTPNNGFVGQDTFHYTVSDGTGNQVAGSIVVTVNAVGGTAAAKPFGQHVDYAAGSILPNHRTQAQLDDEVRAFYNTWKSRYLVSAGTSNGQPLYRVAFGLGSSATVSEGQGYGMVITALMAGHDSNAKQYLDGLWRFSRLNPSTIDSRLMDWHPQLNDGDDSAFDGDADIAYGLLLAHVQWGSGGAINYSAEAATVIAAIYSSTIGPDSHLPELGDWVSTNGSPYSQWTPRSSDFMPSYFRAFGRATNDSRWDAVVTATQSVINSLQANYAASTGLLPDFIVNANTAAQPAPASFLEGPHDNAYGYNASRDPWRIGLDGLINGDATSIAQVRRISNWAEGVTGGDPQSFASGYRLNGTVLSGRNYFSTAFVGPLGVAAMNNSSQQAWLNRIYDSVITTFDDYYEDSVNLLSLIAMSGNFWDATTTVGGGGGGGGGGNATVSLRAIADAYVRAGSNANRNFGTATQLYVRNHTKDGSDSESFLRFDLSGVTGQIESATLTLTPKSIGSQMPSGGSFRIRLVDDSADGWIEGNGGTNNDPLHEIRWNNKPTGTGAEMLVSGAQLTVRQAIAVDVASLLAQGLNANGIATFHLDVPSASSSGYVYFYSDEYSMAAYRPTLVVTTRSANEAVSTRIAQRPVAGPAERHAGDSYAEFERDAKRVRSPVIDRRTERVILPRLPERLTQDESDQYLLLRSLLGRFPAKLPSTYARPHLDAVIDSIFSEG